MKLKNLTVTELNNKIKSVLETDFILKSVKVIGLIDGLKKSGDKYYFFILKDEKSSIQCSIFDLDVVSKIDIANGMTVIIDGRIRYFEKKGSLSLVVNNIELPDEQIVNIFEKNKKEIEKLGYTDPRFKQVVPTEIRNLALITSKTGAAIKDFLDTLVHENTIINIVLFDSLVQGIKAPASVISAVQKANKKYAFGNFDAILLTRGGGSKEDLFCFNDIGVCKAIFESKVPIITAIGHAVDTTLVDLVSDKFYITPTAAASNIASTNSYDFHIKRAYKLIEQITSAVDKKLSSKERVVMLSNPANLRGMVELIFQKKENQLTHLKRNLITSMERQIEYSDKKIQNLAVQLDSLSPLKVMNRGYSLTVMGDVALMDTDSVKVGDTVTTFLKDGKIISEVKEIKKG